ncbi:MULTISPECIES: hypothetical protein [unclassified Mesorhizobium]|uniref:hypothetical protein n=1 Tax=unclassified Mesorhizobium TaxID=325217 RepID=UPI0011262735|nr:MULTISPECIES: hypothetical protein [unclassified Mesorhizobium]MBZ9807909.1 hypothetical protein [Mesorhizobium sp. ESP-6-2]MBZ9941763.1 hypothetical protein [Mesorhizobium sp. BR1-1-13]TPM31106.1 hypothetical protein FJ955_08820 [Mesorhizobium sp. B2-2-2]
MKTTIVCAAIVLATSSAAVAHEKKKTVNADACAGLSIKAAVAAKLDCTATGTGISPQTDAAKPKARLGYDDASPGMPSFGL